MNKPIATILYHKNHYRKISETPPHLIIFDSNCIWEITGFKFLSREFYRTRAVISSLHLRYQFISAARVLNFYPTWVSRSGSLSLVLKPYTTQYYVILHTIDQYRSIVNFRKSPMQYNADTMALGSISLVPGRKTNNRRLLFPVRSRKTNWVELAVGYN